MNKITYKEFKDEWLSEIQEGNPSSVVLGNRFSNKIVMQWLELDKYSDDLIFCDGSGDGGIDVAFLQRGDKENLEEPEGDTWYLIQSKYGSAFRSATTLITESSKVFNTLLGERNLSSLAQDLLERLIQFTSKASERDKLVLVFATVDQLTDEERSIVEDIRTLGKKKLGQIFDVESISVETIYRRVTEEEEASNKIVVPFKGQLVPSGDELLVGSVKLVDLYDFLKNYKSTTGDLDLIYEKNVRKFLGNKRKVNKGIERTLVEKPERFGLYNNGITIVVQDFRELGSGDYSLTEPYIVNGCQTTKTIWSVLLKKLDSGGTGTDPNNNEYLKKLDKGIVVVKVVKVGSRGEDLLMETTKYTNSQNGVTEKDFLALERDFRTWADQMASKYNVYLEIQRGGWDSRKVQQKQNPNLKPFFKEDEYANCFDLIKVYAASWLGEAGLAFGKNPPFSPGGTIFNQIVNDPGFGLNELYASYLLSKNAETFKFGRGAEKYSRGQTRYLFFFILLELLKDVILKAGLSERYLEKSFYTNCVLELSKAENQNAFKELQQTAIDVVDEYMTQGGEQSYLKEPLYKGDINSFLKSEQLGKGDSTPIIKGLIEDNKRVMKKYGKHYDDLITIIRGTDIHLQQNAV